MDNILRMLAKVLGITLEYLLIDLSVLMVGQIILDVSHMIEIVRLDMDINAF